MISPEYKYKGKSVEELPRDDLLECVKVAYDGYLSLRDAYARLLNSHNMSYQPRTKLGKLLQRINLV